MMDTYEMHRCDEDREHVLSAECWCSPRVIRVPDEDSDEDED